MSIAQGQPVLLSDLQALTDRALAIGLRDYYGDRTGFYFAQPMFEADSETEMLSGKGDCVSTGGRLCVRRDLKKVFRPIDSPTTRLENWQDTEWKVIGPGESAPTGPDKGFHVVLYGLGIYVRGYTFNLMKWIGGSWSLYGGWVRKLNDIRQALWDQKPPPVWPAITTLPDGTQILPADAETVYWGSRMPVRISNRRPFTNTDVGLPSGIREVEYRTPNTPAGRVDIVISIYRTLGTKNDNPGVAYPWQFAELGLWCPGAIGFALRGHIFFAIQRYPGSNTAPTVSFTGPYISSISEEGNNFLRVYRLNLSGVYGGEQIKIRATPNTYTDDLICRFYQQEDEDRYITLSGSFMSSEPCDAITSTSVASTTKCYRPASDLICYTWEYDYDHRDGPDPWYWKPMWWQRAAGPVFVTEASYVPVDNQDGVFVAKINQLPTVAADPYYTIAGTWYHNLASQSKTPVDFMLGSTRIQVQQRTEFAIPPYPTRPVEGALNPIAYPNYIDNERPEFGQPLYRGSIIYEIYVRRAPTRIVAGINLPPTNNMVELTVTFGCIVNGNPIAFAQTVTIPAGAVDARKSVDITVFEPMYLRCLVPGVYVEAIVSSAHTKNLQSIQIPGFTPDPAVPLLAKMGEETANTLAAIHP